MTPVTGPDVPACDPEMPSVLSPVPHDYEPGEQERGSLTGGGSYDQMRCRNCHRTASAPLPDLQTFTGPVTQDGEWAGELHTLTVHAVRAPAGPLDDGDLDYDIGHPPDCKQEEVDYGSDTVRVLAYTCDVAGIERDGGLAFTLRYSGTPVTEPGTYQIQAWGQKYWTECGDEYDNGIAIVAEDHV
jgi:hypothetical protein